jgi:hypothetical protein
MVGRMNVTAEDVKVIRGYDTRDEAYAALEENVAILQRAGLHTMFKLGVRFNENVPQWELTARLARS